MSSIASDTISADILKSMATSGWAKPVSYNPYRYLHLLYDSRTIVSAREEYPGLYEGEYGPTACAHEAASLVSGALFTLCSQCCGRLLSMQATNISKRKSMKEFKANTKKREIEKKTPRYTSSSREAIKAALAQTPNITVCICSAAHCEGIITQQRKA
ncbi:hypothetical protein JG687_00014822 [Phytophthora cactorum]|uniref:Uncharacterized protein n=1 Tax=Phytophthora cactorum TaxID=29920 RepID=A0A8T1TZQ3_9STRA|nr:hypothetical protein JG687_00014822 [Phytophthora cactorum]